MGGASRADMAGVQCCMSGREMSGDSECHTDFKAHHPKIRDLFLEFFESFSCAWARPYIQVSRAHLLGLVVVHSYAQCVTLHNRLERLPFLWLMRPCSNLSYFALRAFKSQKRRWCSQR